MKLALKKTFESIKAKSKSNLMHLKKGKFWQKRMKMLYPPPPSSFFAMMTQDIQIAKFLNSLLKMANI